MSRCWDGLDGLADEVAWDEKALATAAALGDGGYAAMIRSGLAGLRVRLEATP